METINMETDEGSIPDRNISNNMLRLADVLNNALENLVLPKKVICVYSPTIYARVPFEMYINKYCNTEKRIMFVGINPGPWGMSQTGVPFGEVDSVKNWLEIQGQVDKPPQEIANRPVEGFACKKSEISGKKFWGLFKELCGTSEKFFQSSFVYNYIPQQWMAENGKNVTPSDFTVGEMKPVFDICDPIFKKVIELYKVEIIIAIGKFAEKRAKKVLGKSSNVKVISIKHPSPLTRTKVEVWKADCKTVLEENDLMQYFI